MMAENLASRDGRPVLDLEDEREVTVQEFSFSGGGTGGGGLAGRGGGVYGALWRGGGGAGRFLAPVMGLGQGVDVWLWE